MAPMPVPDYPEREISLAEQEHNRILQLAGITFGRSDNLDRSRPKSKQFLRDELVTIFARYDANEVLEVLEELLTALDKQKSDRVKGLKEKHQIEEEKRKVAELQLKESYKNNFIL